MSQPTADQAIVNAARLLERAELELINPMLMDRFDTLAGSWLRMAELLSERERV
ncbi:hypothetical protein [Streptomyces sp. NPDC051577]|uniref:hypothetical protein n=1 Tax=Streptomyces sp. NPDC051577 TaxID=3155166 RepID=UPI0034230833